MHGVVKSIKKFLSGSGQSLVRAAVISLVSVVVLTFLYHSLPFALNTALTNYLPLAIGFALHQHVWVRLRGLRRAPRPATARR
jgi:hypothetical protein